MKNKVAFLVTFALAACVAAPAMGADLGRRPVYTAPPPAPVAMQQSWTGCYIGANGGYGWAHKNWRDFHPYTDQGSSTATGGVAGGQIGCDYQTGAFVFGLQGMWDWADLKGSHPYASDPFYTDHSKVSSIASATGRIGYLVQPATLLYVKGGAAWVRDEFTETCADPFQCPASAKATRSGWTIGGGVEYRFLANWSAFVEYNYMDFGTRTSTLLLPDASTYRYDIKQDVQTVLVGVNYRFGWLGGP